MNRILFAILFIILLPFALFIITKIGMLFTGFIFDVMEVYIKYLFIVWDKLSKIGKDEDE